MARRASYGIDAPNVVRNLLAIGLALALVAVVLWNNARFSNLAPGFLLWSASFLLPGLLMLHYATRGKYRHRDRILAKATWHGDETVLDVGTGRGLLAIGAAKRLTTGTAVGIDIWSTKDLSGNQAQAVNQNAQLEGVADRVKVHTMDATSMTFKDASFDVIVSNLCLHNIPTRDGRAAACREIARVLKPGGVALISDMAKTASYARVFREAGLTVRRGGPHVWDTFPFLRIVTARKPEGHKAQNPEDRPQRPDEDPRGPRACRPVRRVRGDPPR